MLYYRNHGWLNPRLWNLDPEEPRREMADCKLYLDFQPHGESVPLIPMLFRVNCSRLFNWIMINANLKLFFFFQSQSKGLWCQKIVTHLKQDFFFLLFHTVHGVLKARLLKWFTIPFSSRPHFVRTLHHDPSVLGAPTEIKLPTSVGSSKNLESSRKTSALLTMPKPLTMWNTTNCGRFFKRWEYQTTWPTSWKIYMQVRKQQLVLNMEWQTGSK